MAKLIPSAALSTELINRTPNFRKGGNHPRTLEKILSVEELPRHNEVVDLLVYSEVVARNDPELHEEVFGMHRLMAGQNEMGLWGGFPEHDVYHILTKEFIEALVEEIKRLNLAGQIIEVAAGKGKLSYWLNQYGIPVIATDINPRNPSVVKIEAREALKKYEPVAVISSWLWATEPNIREKYINSTLQKAMLETNTVQWYLELGCIPSHQLVDGSGRDAAFERRVLTEAASHSIPVDLFINYRSLPAVKSGENTWVWNSSTIQDSNYHSRIINLFWRHSEKFLAKHPSVYLWQRNALPQSLQQPLKTHF